MKRYLSSRRVIILAIVLLAFTLRGWAAIRMEVDDDEPEYMETAYDYAKKLRKGDFGAVIDYPDVREHPPLPRLLFSLTMLSDVQAVDWTEALFPSRLISAVFGTLAVWLVAIVDPLAGGLMAVQTYMVKYTSQAYQEALPLFASLAALFTLLFSKTRRDRWFWVSSAALGMTAAGKYTYFPILVVILYVYFWEKKYPGRDLIWYFGLAGVTFLAFNPNLWHAPLRSFYESVAFHFNYAKGKQVREVGFPWYQPLVWLSRSKPRKWHPDVFFYNPTELISLDGLISLLALVAIPLVWKEQRWVVIWMVSGIAFLLLWGTKWPQYILIVVPALCLAASTLLKRLFRFVMNRFKTPITPPSSP